MAEKLHEAMDKLYSKGEGMNAIDIRSMAASLVRRFDNNPSVALINRALRPNEIHERVGDFFVAKVSRIIGRQRNLIITHAQDQVEDSGLHTMAYNRLADPLLWAQPVNCSSIFSSSLLREEGSSHSPMCA